MEALSLEDLSKFSKDKKQPYNRQNVCKECKNSKDRSRWLKNNKAKPAYYKRVYDCTLEEYQARMETSGTCECCGSTKKLCYDHDHKTMEFRGVLCNMCNIAIGQLGDYMEDIENAYKYMQRHYKENK